MKNTGKIFTCLNFSLMFALTFTISGEAMRHSGGPVRGGTRPSYYDYARDLNLETLSNSRFDSRFGPPHTQTDEMQSDNTKRLPRPVKNKPDIIENTTSYTAYANCPSLLYLGTEYTPMSRKDFSSEDFKESSTQTSPQTSCELMDGALPVADFIIPRLNFVLRSKEELLKFIPNISMKGIMGQLLDQYGQRFPAHEMTLSCLTQSSPEHAPICILDYNNHTTYETGGEMLGQYIAVEFGRILVRPTAYALRSAFTSVHINHLKSFTFSGKLPNGKWVVIDERVNSYQLARPTAICVFFVNTDHYFSAFKITQTDKSHAGLYMFALAGFDVHGEVKSSQFQAE